MFPVIKVGPFAIQSPILILLAGFYLATISIGKSAKNLNLDTRKVENVILFCAAAGFLGARLGFVLQNLDAFTNNWVSIFSLNGTMLDVSSGLLFSFIIGLILLRKYNIQELKFLDAVSMGGVIFVISVFMSSFSSGNDLGSATKLVWGIDFAGKTRHPVQIYEMLTIIALVFIVWFLNKKKILTLPVGGLFFTNAALLATAILILDVFHEYSDYVLGGRQDQVIAWIILAISLILLEWLYRKENKMSEGKRKD